MELWMTAQCCICKQTLNLFFIFLSFFLFIFNDSYILIKRHILAFPSFRVRGTGWSSSVLSITDSANSYVDHSKIPNANKRDNIDDGLDTGVQMENKHLATDAND